MFFELDANSSSFKREFFAFSRRAVVVVAVMVAVVAAVVAVVGTAVATVVVVVMVGLVASAVVAAIVAVVAIKPNRRRIKPIQDSFFGFLAYQHINQNNPQLLIFDLIAVRTRDFQLEMICRDLYLPGRF